MLLLLSPAKSLNLDILPKIKNYSLPQFNDEIKILVSELKKFSPQKIMQLMKISEKLASLNYQRFQDFDFLFTVKNSLPALFIFDGDVYDGIDVENYSAHDLNFAQEHLRILSGLYGILRPLDLIQAYRLEMSTPLKTEKCKNLYEFWQEKITQKLNDDLKNHQQKIIINLASKEYFDAVATSKIKGEIVNIIFKDQGKIIGIFAKKARGLMADYIIKNKIDNLEKIKNFTIDGYKFLSAASSQNDYVFAR